MTTIRSFFYTQIKPNDFNELKKFCKPFTKDIFGASQEYLVGFENPEDACRAALQFLNQAESIDPEHPYKIILLLGEFLDSKPQEITIRIARSIHRKASPRNLYVTDEIIRKLNPEQTTYEKKSAVMVKELQKEIPMYALTRIDDIELSINPTDLFDFSQVDSYSSVDPSTSAPTVPAASIDGPTGPHPSEVKLELGTPRNVPPEKKPSSSFSSIPMDSGKITPLTSGKISPVITGKISPYSATQPSASKPPSSRPTKQPLKMDSQSQIKSIAIVAVVILLISIGGFLFSQRSDPKNVFQAPPEQAPNLQIPVTPTPQVPSQVTNIVKADPDVKIGYVNVKSNPSGAEVWIDGKKLSAKTPIDHWRVTSDRPISVDVAKSGYQKANKRVGVGPLETMTVSFQLNALKSTKPTTSSKSKTSTKKTTTKKTTTKKKK